MRAPDVRTPPARGANAEDGNTENTAIVGQPDEARKDPFESLRALAALHGHRVHRLDGGGGFIIVGPMGWTSRELRDVHALAQALRAMGVRV